MRIKRHLLAGAAAVALMGVGKVVHAAGLSESASAPSSNVIASQLTDIQPLDASQDGFRDYTDNGGPVGETFTVSSPANVTAITVHGAHDAGNLDPNQNFHIEIGTINPTTGLITQLHAETAPETATPDSTIFLTFTLNTPVPVTSGAEYEFSIYSEAGWYGLAHSASGSRPGNGGSAFNYDVSTVSTGNNQDGNNPTVNNGKNQGWPTPGYVALNPAGYEYVFAVQGTPVSIPEPVGAATLGLAALVVRRRRA